MHRYVLFVSLLAALFPWGQAAGEEPPLRLLVPAYFYPAGDGLKEWNRLLASAARAPITAIVNPDSGPGKKADENYRQLCQLAKKSKISLIGYVTLSYGKRPVSAVKGEIDSWLYFYPEVVGIFFDEQPSQAVDAPFAKECFAYAQQKIAAAQVVANPGVPCAAEYLAGRQPPAVCLFEHETGFAEYQPPEWSKKINRDHFTILLYNQKSTQEMQARLAEILSKHAGLLYITDAEGGMPWGRLPKYWDDEVAAVAAANRQEKAVGKNYSPRGAE